MSYYDNAMIIQQGINPYAEFNGHRATLSDIRKRLAEKGYTVYECEGFTLEDQQPLPGDSGLWQTKRWVAVPPEITVVPGIFDQSQMVEFEQFTRKYFWLVSYFDDIAQFYATQPGKDDDELYSLKEIEGKEVLIQPTED